VSNRASDYEGFPTLLYDAELLASSKKEQDFVADMKDKYSQYGENTFVSDKQYNYLISIAQWY
jgi:hypothetical protein